MALVRRGCATEEEKATLTKQLGMRMAAVEAAKRYVTEQSAVWSEGEWRRLTGKEQKFMWNMGLERFAVRDRKGCTPWCFPGEMAAKALWKKTNQ